MSFLCLICKERLAPRQATHNGVGDDKPDPLVATSCGHLYHKECLYSWLKTERLKLQRQDVGQDGNGTKGSCPYCQEDIDEVDNRIVYPIVDTHVEALEKAQYFEKVENLEIYCHQLEIHNQQLQRENEIIRESVSSSPTSPTDDHNNDQMILMKNDRVVWIKPGEAPQAGTLLSISKKSGKLTAKIKMDHKIKSNNRSSGILSSFRTHDKNAVTVPFDEILPEKEFLKHNSISTVNMRVKTDSSKVPAKENKNRFSFTQFFAPSSARSSTVSLPDLDIGVPNSEARPRRLSGIKESEDDIFAIAEAKNPVYNRSFSSPHPSQSDDFSSRRLPMVEESYEANRNSFNESFDANRNSFNGSFDDNRDYVFITPSSTKDENSLSAGHSESSIRSKSPDPYPRLKHVTFAEKEGHGIPFIVGDHVVYNCATDMKNKSAIVREVDPVTKEVVIDILDVLEELSRPQSVKVRPSELTHLNLLTPSSEPRSPMIIINSGESSDVSILSSDTNSSSNKIMELSPSNISDAEIFNFVAPLSTTNPFSSVSSFQMTILDEVDPICGELENNNTTVFDSTLLALMYGTTAFDSYLLQERSIDDDLAVTVKYFLREHFAIPLRAQRTCDRDYAYKLQDLILHLCSSYIDIEEMVTILFEFVFKMMPFIRYSFDMCDYLHQFLIDFTDGNKITTVQHLFHTSCTLQDNLKLKKVPFPALILQIGRSDDKLIHYDAAIPNLTLKIGNLIEERKEDPNRRLCFCDHVATLECTICSSEHGQQAILFCEACRDVLIGVHNGMDHSPNIKVLPQPPTVPEVRPLQLIAVICCRQNQFVTFLRNGPDKFSPWVYISSIVNGQPQMKNLPDLGRWLDELGNNPQNLKDLDKVPHLLRRLLTECRVFIYQPEILSESL